eukprot:3842705-Alexandrium_andersonii.AAC.1
MSARAWPPANGRRRCQPVPGKEARAKSAARAETGWPTGVRQGRRRLKPHWPCLLYTSPSPRD